MCVSKALFRSLRSVLLVAAAGLSVVGCGGAPVPGDAGSNADQTSRIPPIRPAKSAFTSTHPHHFPIHGIDVSKYQGEIDWRLVKAGGTRFAYIKATEGADHVDARFRENWEGAKAAGVARGAYHFVFWCRTPAQEMANFKRIVPIDPDALPPVLDVEATPTSQTCKRRIERNAALREMRAMLQEMERHYGKKPVVYTTVDFYEAVLSHNELPEYPIWVRSTKHSPNVRYGDRNWSFWQYQSDGSVPGIRGNVDRNAFHGSAQQWMAFAGGAAAPAQQRQQVAIQDTRQETRVALVPPGLKAIPGAVAAPTYAGFTAPPPFSRAPAIAPARSKTYAARTLAPKALAPMNIDDLIDE